MPERKISLPLILNAVFLIGLLAVIGVSLLVFRPQTRPALVEEEIIPASEMLTPGLILNNKNKYSGQRLVVRGRAAQNPAVCQYQDCPKEDSCCGCPVQRDLVISDPGIALKGKSKQSLKLVTIANEPLCERRPGSCAYDCPGFKEGAIYDVAGEFVADPPPPGWNLSLDFYFKVNNQELVGKISFMDSVKNLFQAVSRTIGKPKTSGQYVLQ